MKIAIYPGSFDPVTNGHFDIIDRASKIFDKLIVAIVYNPNKTSFFTIEERIDYLKVITKKYDNIEIDHFEGLLINYVQQKQAQVIIKGLRAISDFEYEFQMALMNRKLDSKVETMFMMTNHKYSYLSSSMVKEIGKLGGCIKELVPDEILKDIRRKLKG